MQASQPTSPTPFLPPASPTASQLPPNLEADQRVTQAAAPALNNVSSPPPVQLEETITVNGQKYTISTLLPPGTTELQKKLFVRSFEQNVLKKILVDQKGFKVDGPFTVSFPEEHSFDVTSMQNSSNKKTFHVTDTNGSRDRQYVHSMRNLLKGCSERVEVTPFWEQLLPIASTYKPLRNGGNNCWANALLQLLLRSRDFIELMKKPDELPKELIPLYDFYLDYCSDDKEADSELLRQAIAKLPGGEGFATPGIQQDPYEALELISQFLSPERGSPQFFIHMPIDLPLNPTSLASLLSSRLGERWPRPHTAPSEVWIDLQRNKRGQTRNDPSFKITNEIEIPPELLLPLDGSSPETYRLKAHINHKGSAPTGGHYIAYLLDEIGGLVRCNDESVRRVKEAAAKTACFSSSLLLYQRVNASQEPS